MSSLLKQGFPHFHVGGAPSSCHDTELENKRWGRGAEEKRVGVSHRAHWGRKHIQYIHQTLVSYLRKREKFS